MRVHVRDVWALSVEYPLGQFFNRDRERQWLDQSLFRDSQATDSKGERRLGNIFVSRAKSLRIQD